MITRTVEPATRTHPKTRKAASPSATNPHTLQVPRAGNILRGEAWQTIGLPVSNKQKQS